MSFVENSVEKKYREAVMCLQKNAEALSHHQEFLRCLKDMEFQRLKQENIFQAQLQNLGTELAVLRKETGNLNAASRTKEDIYARFAFPWASVEPGSRIILYGGGVVGKTFLEQLARNSYCSVMAVCDKDPAGTGIYELPVITVRKLAGMAEESYDMILIAIEKRTTATEIKAELELAGIPGEKIRWFDPKTTYRS